MKTLVRSACVAVLMLLLVATASPAVAKGPLKVDVTGPGVETTLRFNHAEHGVNLQSFGDATRIYDIYGTNRAGPAPDLTEEALGARYVLTWDMGEGAVVQHAYPFAEGGAWVRLLPGQSLFGQPIADGWSSAPALTDAMVALGATAGSTDAEAEPALATVEPAAAPVASDDESSGGGTSYDVAVPAGLLLAGVLAIGGVVVWRRRATR